MTRYLSFIGLLFLVACQNQPTEGEASTAALVDPLTTEAREDSLALEQAYEGQAQIKVTVQSAVETSATRAQAMEDAADDPAIWVHPTDRSRSLVFGTNKQGGLAAYNLHGQEVAYYPVGKANNVDVLYHFPLGADTITLLGYSNRTDQSIDLWRIDPTDGTLTNIAAGALAVDTTLIDDIYGFCFASIPGHQYMLINGKNGLLQQFELQVIADKVGLQLVRSVQFPSQTEGMVADADLGYLYVGEEAGGIWKLRITPTDTTRALIPNSSADNPNIRYDIEGLSIYRSGLKEGFLLASIQGNFSYAVFDRAGNNDYLGSFKITNAAAIDGVEETDGIDIVSDSLSPAYPAGLFVAQDGFNYAGDSLRSQNFKYVNWQAISW